VFLEASTDEKIRSITRSSFFDSCFQSLNALPLMVVFSELSTTANFVSSWQIEKKNCYNRK